GFASPNSGDGAVRVYPVPQLLSESVRQQLVTAFEAVDFSRPQRNTAQSQYGCLPDDVESGILGVANPIDSSRPRAILLQERSDRHSIQGIQSDAKGPVFVLEAVHVGSKIEIRQLPPLPTL